MAEALEEYGLEHLTDNLVVKEELTVSALRNTRPCRVRIQAPRGGPLRSRTLNINLNNITSFYGSSCANNGKDALDTPGTLPLISTL